MRVLRAVVLLVVLASSAFSQDQTGGRVFEQIEETIQKLSQTTGWEARRRVPYDLIGRGELKTFLEQRIKEEVKPEEIRVEEMLLKKFGFVPEDFDLKKTTIDLYTEQAAAFYDFKKKKLYILDSSDADMQDAALVHELAHALADQHFKLQRYLDRAGANDDGALARMAVMEGQATWLMAELTVQETGRSMLQSPELVDTMAKMIGGSSGHFPVFDNAPLYIRESLIFPYTAGMKFQHAVLRAMGKEAFAEVFRRPPSTTQQVLHPDRYLKPSKIEGPNLLSLTDSGRYRTVAEGTVGEFDYAVLLRQYIDEDTTRRLAPAWRAASYRLLEHKQNKHTVMLQASRWDSTAVAGEFFKSYARILEGKWKRFELSGQTETRLFGRGDDGFFQLRLDGECVYSIEGMNAPDQVR